MKADHVTAETERHRLRLNALRLPRFARLAVPRPFVLALEGANGVGKTTLCRNLSRALGAPACLGTDGAWFSDAFKTRMIRDAEWPASAMFFLSGCCEQMRVLAGRPVPLVVMDRSIWSTLAVHGAESAGRLKALLAMLQPIAAQVRVPDLTLVLEASFAACQTRIAKKTGTARALDELTATAVFHGKEQEFYRWLGRRRREVRFLEVERIGAEEVLKRALALVRKEVKC